MAILYSLRVLLRKFRCLENRPVWITDSLPYNNLGGQEKLFLRRDAYIPPYPLPSPPPKPLANPSPRVLPSLSLSPSIFPSGHCHHILPLAGLSGSTLGYDHMIRMKINHPTCSTPGYDHMIEWQKKKKKKKKIIIIIIIRIWVGMYMNQRKQLKLDVSK